MKTRGVPYLEGPPGSEPYYGGEGLIDVNSELSNQGVEQVFEPQSETDSGCMGRLSNGTRCRKGKKPLCGTHLHLKK